MKKTIYDLRLEIEQNKYSITELMKTTYRLPTEREVNRVAELELENYKLKQQLNFKLSTLANENETK